MSQARAATLTSGTVVEFDDQRGLGEVRSDDNRRFAFHCTNIADGSRTIETGTTVWFTVVAGSLGRWEAAEVHAAVRPKA